MRLYIYKIKILPTTAPLIKDAQKMHAALCEMCGCTRKNGNILWSYDDEYGYLKVQSDAPLSVRDGFELVGSLDLDKQQNKYKNGSQIHFQLTTDFHKKHRGKQIYVNNLSEAENRIREKLAANGLDVENVRFIQKRTIYFSHSIVAGGNASITVWDLDIRGRLSNAEIFWQAWHSGVGQHKAYGNGLCVLKN